MNNDNIYQSPRSNIHQYIINSNGERAVEYVSASIWRRLLAYLVDLAILILILLSANINIFFIEKLQTGEIVTGANLNIKALIAFFAYYVIFHYLVASTPGKLLARIKVVSVNGGKASFAQLMLRDLLTSRYVPWWYKVSATGMLTIGSTFIAQDWAFMASYVLIGYFLLQNGLVIFTKNRISVADKLARTRVVRINSC